MQYQRMPSGYFRFTSGDGFYFVLFISTTGLMAITDKYPQAQKCKMGNNTLANMILFADHATPKLWYYIDDQSDDVVLYVVKRDYAPMGKDDPSIDWKFIASLEKDGLSSKLRRYRGKYM